MTLITHKLVSFATIFLLAAGIGIYSLTGSALGQRTDGPDVISVPGSDDGGAAGLDVRLETARKTMAMAKSGPRRFLDASKRIQSQLLNDVDIDFVDLKIEDVAEYFQEKLKIPIVIDWKSLEDVGLDKDTFFNLKVEEISGKSALRLLLDEQNLDYVIENEVLMITTQEEAELRLVTRVYKTQVKTDADGLVKLITTVIAPDMWQETGGPGVIQALDKMGDQIVISTTERVHDQVADLLLQLNPTDVNRRGSLPPGGLQSAPPRERGRSGAGTLPGGGVGR